MTHNTAVCSTSRRPTYAKRPPHSGLVQVLELYRERTNSTRRHSRDQRRGALSIQRLEGGCWATAVFSSSGMGIESSWVAKPWMEWRAASDARSPRRRFSVGIVGERIGFPLVCPLGSPLSRRMTAQRLIAPRARFIYACTAAASAVTNDTGGARRRIGVGISRVIGIIGPPHLGQVQSGTTSSAAGLSASSELCGKAPSKWKQSGNKAARRRLARKPKFRMRTNPRGST